LVEEEGESYSFMKSRWTHVAAVETDVSDSKAEGTMSTLLMRHVKFCSAVNMNKSRRQSTVTSWMMVI